MKIRLKTVAATLLLAGCLVTVFQLQLRSEPTQPQTRFSAIQFTRSDGGWWFFDTRSGDIWIYDEERKLPLWHFRLKELGQPLEKIQLPEGVGLRPRTPRQARP